MHQRTIGLLPVLLWMGMAAAHAHHADDMTNKVDALVKAEMAKRQIPGVSVAVAREGKPVLLKGYGLANVELSAAATKDTVYQLASVTKQFTATGIMMLVEEGKLSLDDAVTKLLPNLPKAWDGVTVRHLLDHTSGISSYTSLPNFFATPRKDYAKEELIKLVTGLPMNFPPGEKWAYNNTGYYLLGMIIEQAAGKSYSAFLEERIFKPLGMSATRLNDMAAIIPNRASGYSRAAKGLRNGEFVSPTQPFAAGALVSSVVDMAKWDAALYTEKLLKKSTLAQMWTSSKLNDGKETGYGFGWAVGAAEGHRRISHGGGIMGFATHISRFPKDRLTIVVLSNLDGEGAEKIAQGIAGIFIPALAPREAKAIADNDPKFTEMMKGVMVATAEGKLSPDLFTEEMHKLLFPDRVNMAKEFLAALGPMKAMQLLEHKEEGKSKRRRYRVQYEQAVVLCDILINEAGKIAALRLQPE